jgi:hypothetical protein
MKILIIPLLIFLSLPSISQDRRIKFNSINQVGLISGSAGEAFMLQSVNGLKKDKWFTGAGIGLDFYNERTIPLFFDIRRDLVSKKNTPFAYIDAGVNFLWLNSIEKEQKQFSSSSPGLFYDLGIGLRLSGQNNRGFILSAGYSFKQVKENIKSSWLAPTPELGSDNYLRYNYLYRRIVIKMGIQL